MMNKSDIDLNTVLVKLKFLLKGNRQMVTVHTTAGAACDFVDWLNDNRHQYLTKAEKEKFDNRYYVFDDYKDKSTVCIERDSIKMMSVPFYLEDGDQIKWMIADI